LRALAALAAFNALALLLGLAIMTATGLVRARVSSALPAVGAALVVGVGTIGTASAAALVLGAVGVMRARGDAGERWRLPRPSAGVWAPVAAVVVFSAVQVASSWRVPIAWDAAHIWTVKAMSLATTGGLDGQLFSEHSQLPTSHQDYPLLHPAVGALIFRFAARMQQGLLIAELWILIAAAVLAVPWLCRSGARTWLALVPLALAVASAPNQGVLRGDADMPMACFLAVGAICLARLLETSDRGYAIPGAICLAAAANTKNEGLVFGIVLIVCALAFSLRRRRELIAVGAVALIVAALIAPWRLWISAHGPFPSDITPLSTSLHAGYLLDHLPQLDLGAEDVLGHFADPAYGWVVPAFLALTGAAVGLSGRVARTSAHHLVGFVGVVLALLWVYWTSQQPDIVGHVARTTLRTVTAPLLLAGVGLAHLLPELISPRIPPSPGDAGEQLGAYRLKKPRSAAST
jgi:hypothetical protein